ncbi:MAG: rhodanese-like domain-containing protein [Clostridiales bacterium]|nr:rhodanese-like domain-containing protein [Clostridiales bacterium]
MKFSVIHAGEVDDIVREMRGILVDVRPREQYCIHHYKNAISCPYEEMERWICRFPRRCVLVLYCEHGSTSLLAARRLAEQGYRVYTVAGGIRAMEKNFGIDCGSERNSWN